MEKDLEAKFEKGASHNEELRRELRAEMRDMENKIFERLEKNHNLLVSKLENQINLNSLRNDNIETVLYQIRDALLEKGILSSKVSGK